MDGTESKSQLNRCRIFDLLFDGGARSHADIALATKLNASEVRRLVDYEWFVEHRGTVSVAMSRGDEVFAR